MHSVETTASRRSNSGFTIIEVMIVVAIVAILASIAVPAYSSYIRKSHAKAAAGDLVALGLVMENLYQRQLSYLINPASGNRVTLATISTNDTIRYINGVGNGNTLPSNSLWQPAEAANFTYTLTVPTSGTDIGLSYTLNATGRSGTINSGCVLSLTNTNTRSSNDDAGCGGLSSSW